MSQDELNKLYSEDMIVGVESVVRVVTYKLIMSYPLTEVEQMILETYRSYVEGVISRKELISSVNNLIKKGTLL